MLFGIFIIDLMQSHQSSEKGMDGPPLAGPVATKCANALVLNLLFVVGTEASKVPITHQALRQYPQNFYNFTSARQNQRRLFLFSFRRESQSHCTARPCVFLNLLSGRLVLAAIHTGVP